MEDIPEGTKRTALRIIDANANRCSEGLRVLEEIVRFVLEDEELVREFKELRHRVREAARAFSENLSLFRDIERDPGRNFSTKSELSRSGLYEVARSNFSRVAEGLRVIEEFGKLIDKRGAEFFKDLRFTLYRLEQTFFKEADTSIRLPDCPFLYSIIDRSIVGPGDLERVVDELIRGKVDMIQYRAKGVSRVEMEVDLLRIISRASEDSIPVIVNDDPSVAAETGAHGVHLGAEDPPVSEARSLLGSAKIIGVSVHSDDEFSKALSDDVDYVSIGAVFPSPTKPEVEAIGIDKLKEYAEASNKPVVAIGGINRENLEDILSAGVCGVAVISALLRGDVRKNCTALRKIIDKYRKMK